MVPGPQQGRKGQPLRWTLRQEGWPGKGPPQLGAPTREDPGPITELVRAGGSFIHALVSLPPVPLHPALCGSWGHPNPLGTHRLAGWETGVWPWPWGRVSLDPRAGPWPLARGMRTLAWVWEAEREFAEKGGGLPGRGQASRRDWLRGWRVRKSRDQEPPFWCS